PITPPPTTTYCARSGRSPDAEAWALAADGLMSEKSSDMEDSRRASGALVGEDPLRGHLARTARHAAARMRARAALVVAVGRGVGAGIAGGRPHEVHLRRQELTVEDVALAQPGHPLDVERRDHLAVEHQVAEPREVRLQHRLDGVAERLALGVPVT